MDELKILENYQQENDVLSAFIASMCADDKDRTIDIIEAGCGRHWSIDLKDVRFRLTGIDLDEVALTLRQKKYNDLDRAIVADLRTVNLDPECCDVVFNSYVLEHISDAELVLDRFFTWLRPEGLLILRIPDRNSVYGFITRMTPLWFHIFYHKRIRGDKNSGKPGFGPYPTFYDNVVSRAGIHQYCNNHGLQILYEAGHPFYLEGSGFVPKITRLFVRLISALSLGLLPWRHNNLTYVLRKRPVVA